MGEIIINLFGTKLSMAENLCQKPSPTCTVTRPNRKVLRVYTIKAGPKRILTLWWSISVSGGGSGRLSGGEEGGVGGVLGVGRGWSCRRPGVTGRSGRGALVGEAKEGDHAARTGWRTRGHGRGRWTCASAYAMSCLSCVLLC